jgi:alpha-glucosidase
MGYRKLLLCLLPLLAGAAHAQDERSVVSPDGRLEFRIFTVLPPGAGLNTLAYQVWLRGKPLIDTSYLGWNIHFQEPLLGESMGLSAEKPLHGANYNGLFADYLQNSSTGRRVELEVRVWNDGVAFRYLIPPSALLLDLLIEDEASEFRLAQDAAEARPAQASLPYLEQEPGMGWLGIYQSRVAAFPQMYLVREDAHTMISRLPQKPNDPGVAFAGVTPWTSPWRIIAIGADRERLTQSQAVRELAK